MTLGTTVAEIEAEVWKTQTLAPMYNQCSSILVSNGYMFREKVNILRAKLEEFCKMAPTYLGGTEKDWLHALEYPWEAWNGGSGEADTTVGGFGYFTPHPPLTSTATGKYGKTHATSNGLHPYGFTEDDLHACTTDGNWDSSLIPYFTDRVKRDRKPGTAEWVGWHLSFIPSTPDLVSKIDDKQYFPSRLFFADMPHIAHGIANATIPGSNLHPAAAVPMHNDPAYRLNPNHGIYLTGYPMYVNSLMVNILNSCNALYKRGFHKADLDNLALGVPNSGSTHNPMRAYQLLTAQNHGSAPLLNSDGSAGVSDQRGWDSGRGRSAGGKYDASTINSLLSYGQGTSLNHLWDIPLVSYADSERAAPSFNQSNIYFADRFPDGTIWKPQMACVYGLCHGSGDYSGQGYSKGSPITMCYAMIDYYCEKLYNIGSAGVYSYTGTAGTPLCTTTQRVGSVQDHYPHIADAGRAAGEFLRDYCSEFMNILVTLAQLSEPIYDCDKEIDKEFEDKREAIKTPNDWVDEVIKGMEEHYLDDDQQAALGVLTTVVLHGGETMGFYGTTAEKVLFREQCFLLAFTNIISAYKKDKENYFLDTADSAKDVKGKECPKRAPYYWDNTLSLEAYNGNASILLDGNPYGMMNKLTQHPTLPILWDIKNHEISNLQPKIRLFKITFGDDGVESEKEISFDSHMNASSLSMFKKKSVRGVGVGLKYFNFTYDGSNPFSAKKSIKAQLKIFANTFDELVEDRGGYKYTDLAMKTSNTPGTQPADSCAWTSKYVEQNDNLSQLNFRLKAVVGWSVPPGEFAALRPSVKEALYNSFVTLNLTPTVHNFDFDEMGRVTFSLNYLAYAEDFYDAAAYNVFADAQMTANRISRQLKMQEYQKNCTNKKDKEALEATKKEHAAKVDEEQRIAISSLMTRMINKDKIYYINVPYDHIVSFLENGPFQPYVSGSMIHGDSFVLNNAEHNTVVAAAVDSALTEMEDVQKGAGGGGFSTEDRGQIAAALVAVDPKSNNIPFFYLSDLVDIALENIETELDEMETALQMTSGVDRCKIMDTVKTYAKYKKNFKNLRIVLGPIEFVNPRYDGNGGGWSNFVNFGDIPIAVKYFLEWIADRVLRKEETLYTLTRFLNDLMNNLVNNFLNKDDCFRYNIKQKVRVNQSVITSYSPHDQVPGGHSGVKKMTLGGRTFGPNKIDELTHFAIARRDSIKSGRIYRAWSPRINLNQLPLPALNISGQTGGSAITYADLANEINYFIFFAARTMPTELMNGCRDPCQVTAPVVGETAEKYIDPGDHSRGIFHYVLGRDKGLIKNIKLSKTNSKGLAEARFEKEGFDGLEQLRVVYDAEIDMYANVQAFPGTYIYIDPAGFAPATRGMTVDDKPFDLTKLGIGGYYMVVRSKHEFGIGKAKTIVEAKWVNQVDRHAEEDDQTQMGVGDNGLMYPHSKNCPLFAPRKEASIASGDIGGMPEWSWKDMLDTVWDGE